MTPNTHTPTPWNDDIFRDKMNYCYRIGLPTGTIEVRTDYGDLDAAHIVHCVNTHDALVEASKQYLEAVRVCINNGFEGPQFDAMAMASGALRYALAKAEKGMES